jgi:3-oxoacyl-[acyl-carrier-protein] synthase-1
MAAKRLGISAFGIISSVGQGARACAAIRAGISRPREREPELLLVDPSTGEETIALQHPIDGVTDGFALVGAWMNMALEALDDMVVSALLPDERELSFWSRTGLLVVVPADLTSRFGDGGDDLVALERAYLSPLVEIWGRPLNRQATALVPAGNAGGIAALDRARSFLFQNACERIIVLGADSFLDASSIEWLRDTNKLKGPDFPVGIVPGEAAACVLVEAATVATRRHARIGAILEGIAVDQQDRTQFDAKALARAVRGALGGSKTANATGRINLISDHDGQTWRAGELGTMMAECADLPLHWPSWGCPATSLGYIGGASVPVGLGLAFQSFVRGYASADKAVVLGSSENGQVGAVCLSAPT